MRQIETLLADIEARRPARAKAIARQRRRERILAIIDALLRRVGL